MKFLVVTKQQLLILAFFIAFLSIFFCFYTSFAQKPEINNNYILPSSSQNNFSMFNLQEDLDAIYSSNEKVAYLTFDDGPTKIATTKILDVLKENDVHASFFVIGYRVEEFPNIVKRAYKEGHFIANHGYSHNNSKLYKSKNSFISEILDTDDSISRAIGINDYHSYIFRFPNGSKSTKYSVAKKNCKNYLKEIGYSYIDWNALNNDSIKKYSSYELLNNLKNSVKGKNSLVILMHDTIDVSKSYESLDSSIKFLKEQGYSFKTFYDLVQGQNLK